MTWMPGHSQSNNPAAGTLAPVLGHCQRKPHIKETQSHLVVSQGHLHSLCCDQEVVDAVKEHPQLLGSLPLHGVEALQELGLVVPRKALQNDAPHIF